MGGEASAESRLGEGACFTFSFLSEVRSAPPQQTSRLTGADAPASLKGVRILLVDDNAINRQVVKLLLAADGVALQEATNGQEGLDKLEASSDAEFDLVLLDVHMPVIDGIEAIKHIRASDRPWARIPVVALTADAMAGDQERLMKLGMNGYVAKPISRHTLVQQITQALDFQPPSTAAPPIAKRATSPA